MEASFSHMSWMDATVVLGWVRMAILTIGFACSGRCQAAADCAPADQEMAGAAGPVHLEERQCNGAAILPHPATAATTQAISDYGLTGMQGQPAYQHMAYQRPRTTAPGGQQQQQEAWFPVEQVSGEQAMPQAAPPPVSAAIDLTFNDEDDSDGRPGAEPAGLDATRESSSESATAGQAEAQWAAAAGQDQAMTAVMQRGAPDQQQPQQQQQQTVGGSGSATSSANSDMVVQAYNNQLLAQQAEQRANFLRWQQQRQQQQQQQHQPYYQQQMRQQFRQQLPPVQRQLLRPLSQKQQMQHHVHQQPRQQIQTAQQQQQQQYLQQQHPQQYHYQPQGQQQQQPQPQYYAQSQQQQQQQMYHHHHHQQQQQQAYLLPVNQQLHQASYTQQLLAQVPVLQHIPTMPQQQQLQQQQQAWDASNNPQVIRAPTSQKATTAASQQDYTLNSISSYKRPRAYEDPGVKFSVTSGSEFSVKVIGNVPDTVNSYIRLTPGARCDKKKKKWYLPLRAYQPLYRVFYGLAQKGVIHINHIPDHVITKLTAMGTGATDAQLVAHEAIKGHLPESLLGALAPFQKEGVAFVKSKEGRALLADEMGLGKSIQAVAAAHLYRQQWPLLIICPSSARFHWEAELLKWFERDYLPAYSILVITAKAQVIRSEHQVVIISYDLAQKMHETLEKKEFDVVIADECHYLKNKSSRRSKNITPLLQKASCRLLLSGTPALSRPRELWSQLNILDPEVFPDEKEFLHRYCAHKRGRPGKRRAKKGNNKDGASNRRELHELLKATVMIRRCKKDILKHLPPKKRVKRNIEVADEALRGRLLNGLLELKRAEARLGRLASRKTNQILAALQKLPALQSMGATADGGSSTTAGEGGGRGRGARRGGGTQQEDDDEDEDDDAQQGPQDVTELQARKKALLMEMFMQTGMAKVPAVVDRVKTLLADELSGKLLIFAHHRDVLDLIERKALKGVPHIRIDGSTHPKERQTLTERFQTEAPVRVALLSLTAAGVAITLTAANRAIFAELFWTPAALLQAEDRAHRIGQLSEVVIEYIFAKGSLDECLWPLVRSKMRVLGEVVEGAEKLDLDAIEADGINDELATTVAADKEISELAKEDVDRGAGGAAAEGEDEGEADDVYGADDDGESEDSDDSDDDNDDDDDYEEGDGRRKAGSDDDDDSDNDVTEVLCIDDSSSDEEEDESQPHQGGSSMGQLKDDSAYGSSSACGSGTILARSLQEGGREVFEIIDDEDEEEQQQGQVECSNDEAQQGKGSSSSGGTAERREEVVCLDEEEEGGEE